MAAKVDKKRSQQELRQIALSAARSELRRRGIDPLEVDCNHVWGILDDLLRTEPELLASRYHAKADVQEQARFKNAWITWQRQNRPTFEQINEMGAKEFGADWLTMSRHIRDTALAVGFTPDEKGQRLLAAIALKVLRVVRASKPKATGE